METTRAAVQTVDDQTVHDQPVHDQTVGLPTVHSQLVDVQTGDGVADALLAQPDGGGAHPGVLFYMDAFGLRPRLEEMARQIAAAGYVVLVPNVFYRQGRAPLVDLSDLADLTNPDRRASVFATLGPMMAALTPASAMADAEAYLRFLEGLQSTSDGPVGITGYCMGGALALRTAAAYPARVAAVGSFHGGRLATDASDSPHLLADEIQAELYLGHADQDHSMPPDQIVRLESALDLAGVDYRSELYVGAGHGFTMADTAAYDAEATERHWSALLDLLSRRLTE